MLWDEAMQRKTVFSVGRGLWVAKGLVDRLLLGETGMFLETRHGVFSGFVLAPVRFYWRGCRNGWKRLFIYLNLENPRGTFQHIFPTVPSRWIRTLNECSCETYRQLKRSESNSHQPQARGFCRWRKSGDADESGLNICSSWSHVKWVFTSPCKWFGSRLFFGLGFLG